MSLCLGCGETPRARDRRQAWEELSKLTISHSHFAIGLLPDLPSSSPLPGGGSGDMWARVEQGACSH